MRDARCDTLIIGQGLAGSALAWHLLQRGERVCVLDDGHHSSSSRIAAGLINPLAGMRFNRRPQVDQWLDSAQRWYTHLATQFGLTFYHPLPMLRLFRSREQRRFYDRRRADPASHRLLDGLFEAAHCPEAVFAPHGGFRQSHTGYVDLPLLLTTLANWLRDEHAALRECCVDPRQIRLSDDAVSVEAVRARRLVFCDGVRMRGNPWFDWLPMTPDKGEILDLRDAGWRPGHIINGAHWLIPLHDGGLRFGATHEHTRLDQAPSADARAELLAGYRNLRGAHDAPTITAHRAGIRPATQDRNPLLGRHPEHGRLWVFNGFGARGALAIPWYAERMAAHLLHGDPLPDEADIGRL